MHGQAAKYVNVIDNPLSGRRVLVAGATGYLGRHLVAVLSEQGSRVRALVRPGKTVAGAAEVFEGEATSVSSLRGCCDGVDLVFSALGITRQRDRGVTYEDVDYRANLAVLDEAERAGVTRLGVISVADPARFSGNPMVDAKERFIERLRSSTVEGRVVRATGFFSDMREFLDMARRGTVYLAGNGETRINPIDGRDVARAGLKALAGDTDEHVVGGPEVLSWNEIASLAAETWGRRARIRHVPAGLARAVLPLIRLGSPKTATTADFILRVCAADLVAPTFGRQSLGDYYRAEVRSLKRSEAPA